MNDAPADILENLEMLSAPDPGGWTTPILLLTGGFLLVALALLFLYRKKKLPFQESPPPRPDVSALNELQKIKPLAESGDDRAFVIEVSRILRTYIEGRFGIRAPHLSTEEFLYLAERDDALTSEQQAGLSEFLMQCDRVKFALGRLGTAECSQLYEAAEAFVLQTREPTPQPETGMPS